MLTDPYVDQDPIDEMSFQRHFLRGEKVSILNRLGAVLGLVLLGVEPLERISKRNGLVNLD